MTKRPPKNRKKKNESHKQTPVKENEIQVQVVIKKMSQVKRYFGTSNKKLVSKY